MKEEGSDSSTLMPEGTCHAAGGGTAVNRDQGGCGYAMLRNLLMSWTKRVDFLPFETGCWFLIRNCAALNSKIMRTGASTLEFSLRDGYYVVLLSVSGFLCSGPVTKLSYFRVLPVSYCHSA
ncbi:unnamed protein product [Linum tenue]|uniref:Uncharacterized protein n=2 Tax=Linum tenue TaxID=586396 RepID=A0AAV0QF84_9ROSI|nr:unnamed protein product [Linum tenue]